MVSIDQLASLPKTKEATIPPEYLDSMGHMNVMWYTHLFDEAVYSAFRMIGLDNAYMQANQAGGFALEVHIRYLSEVRVEHHVEIRTRFLARSTKRFHLFHYMINQHKQDIAATFEVVGAHIDMKVRRMAALPMQITEQLDALIAQHAALDWSSRLCGVMAP